MAKFTLLEESELLFVNVEGSRLGGVKEAGRASQDTAQRDIELLKQRRVL